MRLVLTGIDEDGDRWVMVEKEGRFYAGVSDGSYEENARSAAHYIKQSIAAGESQTLASTIIDARYHETRFRYLSEEAENMLFSVEMKK